MESPAKRKAMVLLNVSERITDHSRQEGQVEADFDGVELHAGNGYLQSVPSGWQ